MDTGLYPTHTRLVWSNEKTHYANLTKKYIDKYWIIVKPMVIVIITVTTSGPAEHVRAEQSGEWTECGYQMAF